MPKQPKRKKVGIYPGSFDPIHQGHLAFALAAAQVCSLDKVIFLPEPKPRGKNAAPIEHRVQMLRLAVKPYERLGLEQIDDDQFTVTDTLPKIQKIFNGGELYLLLGSDVATKLDAWPGSAELKRKMKLIVGERSPEADRHSKDSKLIFTSFSGVSSSQVRNDIKDKQGTHHVVPAVADYIKKHALYN